MVSVVLLGIGLVVAAFSPRMAGADWVERTPRLGVLLWQAATVTVLGTTVLAGLTLLAHTAALSSWLADFITACAHTISAAYGSPGQWPADLIGALLAVALPSWLACTIVVTVLRGRRARHQLRQNLELVAQPDPALRAMILEADTTAAFCLPGRQATVVLTTETIRALNSSELAGVIAHERAHLRARHHLPVMVARALSRALPRPRMFAIAANEIARLVELLADDAAAKRVHRGAVASALLRLGTSRSPEGSLAAKPGATAQRIRRLLNPNPPARALQQTLWALAGLIAIIIPIAIAGYPLILAVSTGICTVESSPVG